MKKKVKEEDTKKKNVEYPADANLLLKDKGRK